MQAVLPDAIAFTLLGAIESLLSAVVADGMTGRRHRSNCELVAQGFANIGSALFGGICVTGTIARTATNIRAGAHGPVSGVLHSGFLLVFMLVAAPLASYIPLAALAGVLVWDSRQLPATTMYGMGPEVMPVVIAIGLGILAIGVSSYMTLAARSDYKDALSAHCGGMTNTCDMTGLEITHDARSTANKATIVFFVGVAMAGSGAALYFLAPKAPENFLVR